jgi:hypothetical protein
MTHTPPEPDELSGADDEPYVRLPKPQPRWMQRAMEIDMAIHLIVGAVVLVMMVAEAVRWAVRGIT